MTRLEKETRSKNELNRRLLALYTSGAPSDAWSELLRIRSEYILIQKPRRNSLPAGSPSVGSPFLAAATKEYAEAIVRVMIVGREPFGWDNGGVPFESPQQCMEANENFLGSAGYNSAFWRAARTLSNNLNSNLPSCAARLAWSNIFRLDDFGSTPREKLARALRESERVRALLRKEIEILQPDVLWIACGPAGNWDACRQIEGLTEASRGVRSEPLDAPCIAPVVFRSFHPGGLRGDLAKVVDQFIDVAKRKLAALAALAP